MTILKDKPTAYPYITVWKKEPFRSYALVKRRALGEFYLKDYNSEIEATREILESSVKLFEYAIKKRLTRPFTSVHLKTPITTLEILHIDKDGELHYIFPQEMGLVLLYYNLKKQIETKSYYILVVLLTLI